MMRETRDGTFSNRDFGQEEAGEARARRLRMEEAAAAAARRGWGAQKVQDVPPAPPPQTRVARSFEPAPMPVAPGSAQRIAPSHQPPLPDLDALPDAVLDSLPWPGQSQNRPPAWMLEEDPPQTTEPKQPPAVSAYEQEWNTLRPQVQNPWHSMDEEERKMLVHPVVPEKEPATVAEVMQRNEDGQGSQTPNGIPSLVTSQLQRNSADAEIPRLTLAQLDQHHDRSVTDQVSSEHKSLSSVSEEARIPLEPGASVQDASTGQPQSLGSNTVLNGTVKSPHADRTWKELEEVMGKATVESWREYPRTAEQAAANILESGAKLNEREVKLLYSMFNQKYPGEERRPLVQPTPKIKRPLQPGATVMEAAKPKHLLKDANAAFDEALSAYAASPVEWMVEGLTGKKNEGFSYGPDHAWTKVLRSKAVYDRMRYGPKSISEWAAIKDKEGTLDQYIGWKGDPGKRGLKWDEISDESPWYQPIKDLNNYVTGSELKSSGSVKADIVITHVDHGNRTVTFEVNAYDALRAGSMSRIKGTDKEILEDNSMGPFLYTTPLRWKWTETVRY